MKKYIHVFKKTKLFSGVNDNEILTMLDCLNAKISVYKKNEYIIRQGEHLKRIMILADGKLHIQHDDYWGKRNLISIIDVGDMFGESYAMPESGAFLNDVIAIDESIVISLDIKQIITVCSSACHFHATVVQNLFFIISEKNRKLVQKLGYMANRTTREKLIAYLSDEAKRTHNASFYIPFNRQQLADYLCVDRSAMSNELCKMRNEGLLEFNKNHFKLLL